jgi:hypothetical protein
MKIDVEKSIYHEDAAAKDDFNRDEIRRLRLLLRRLRFLEAQVRKTGGSANGSGGAAFAEWETEALEFVLVELGYLDEDRVKEGKK